MKKILTSASSLVMGLALASSANAGGLISFETAAEVVEEGGTAASNNTSLECELLAESVDLSTSQNVVGGVNCAPINNLIEVATCHKGGTRGYISCATWSASNVIGGVETGNPIAGCADTTGVGTSISFSAFFTSSAGGVMQTRALADAGGAKCDTTAIQTLTFNVE